ncbi:radical SAM protein [Embleya sp. MST-111070]|uniref:radical SAM protein n=1 Tax=Embleya sp. MST-111070 TaxID=3398231 RepID=UPI003F736AD6
MTDTSTNLTDTLAPTFGALTARLAEQAGDTARLPADDRAPRWSFLWLEITGRCPLPCTHCYADSGPTGTHGSMDADDWARVITDAARMGVGMVQFIGGEPTVHPAFDRLLAHALDHGLHTEVFTNLLHVRPAHWALFTRPGVRLATSYYSDTAAEHDAITRRTGSHRRTRANIVRVLERGIPLRAGIIDLGDDQRFAQAHAELDALGVTDIGVDHLRQVGRGIRTENPDATQLCGGCGQGVAAVSPNGDVWPCVFARWMPQGNVRTEPLGRILEGPRMRAASAALCEEFTRRAPCTPDMCNPQCGPTCSPACVPTGCSPKACGPQGPQCQPKYNCGPCQPKDRTCEPDNRCRPNKCRPNP